MVSSGIDATLVERVRRGDYVVDEQAVAEAIVRRWRRDAIGSARRARIDSPVFIAAEPLDTAAVRPDEDEPVPGADVA
jgi:hypothetical protein